MWMTHTHLKARQRAERHQHAEGIALRIHRALSWLLRSELCDDDDGRFIFLWIAFSTKECLPYWLLALPATCLQPYSICIHARPRLHVGNLLQVSANTCARLDLYVDISCSVGRGYV